MLTSNSSCLLCLPAELLLSIFSYLSQSELATSMLVCHRIYVIASDPSLCEKPFSVDIYNYRLTHNHRHVLPVVYNKLRSRPSPVRVQINVWKLREGGKSGRGSI